MKSLIKKLLRENLLSEKLTNIDDDVNLIYDKYFKNDIDEIEKTGFITNDMFLPSETYTNILQTEESYKSDQINQCVIKINDGHNAYDPNKNIIYISVSNHALNYVKDDFSGDLKKSIESLPDLNMQKSLSKEFSEARIKGSIHHELVHWIDDTMNNNHIKKRINKAMELNTRDIGGIPVNSTKMEIQAQIHNIKQLYNKHNENWDEMTFGDMISLSPPLNSVMKSLKSNYKKQWVRDLKTRMHREGLLGKNMVNN